MKASKRKSRARKATYIAFGLVVLAAASCANAEVRGGYRLAMTRMMNPPCRQPPMMYEATN